jgi:hypothetical protein
MGQYLPNNNEKSYNAVLQKKKFASKRRSKPVVSSWQICSKPVASCLISDREILPVELTSLCMQFGEQCLLRSIFLPFR